MASNIAIRFEFEINPIPAPPAPGPSGPTLGVWGVGVWGFRYIWKSLHKGPHWKNGLWVSS